MQGLVSHAEKLDLYFQLFLPFSLLMHQDSPPPISSYHGSALWSPFLPYEIVLEFVFSLRMLFIDLFILNLLTGLLL